MDRKGDDFIRRMPETSFNNRLAQRPTGNQNNKAAYNKKINPTGDKPVLIFQ